MDATAQLFLLALLVGMALGLIIGTMLVKRNPQDYDGWAYQDEDTAVAMSSLHDWIAGGELRMADITVSTIGVGRSRTAYYIVSLFEGENEVGLHRHACLSNAVDVAIQEAENANREF